MNFKTLESCDIYADSGQEIRSHLGNLRLMSGGENPEDDLKFR